MFILRKQIKRLIIQIQYLKILINKPSLVINKK